MKKNKISISAKAMLTDTNRRWSFIKLIHEIDAERKGYLRQEYIEDI